MASSTQKGGMTMTKRLEIIQKLESGACITTLANEYGITKRTIQRYRQNALAIRNVSEKPQFPKMKRNRASLYEDINARLYTWFLQRKAIGEIITDNILQRKATEFHEIFGGPSSFTASRGWLWRFKNKYNIRQITFHSENIHSANIFHESYDFGAESAESESILPSDQDNKPVHMSQDSMFCPPSPKLKPFSNRISPLVIQFSAKREQNIGNNGGYVRVAICSLDQKDMYGRNPYDTMFGPDVCGTRKVYVIYNYKGKNLSINKNIRCKDDIYTHLYTLIVNPENTYQVLIDNEEVEAGALEAHWDLPLQNNKIKQEIEDFCESEIEFWDNPEYTPDPMKIKTENVNDKMSGERDVPMIRIPKEENEWIPREINISKYKESRTQPVVGNCDNALDSQGHNMDKLCAIGFGFWKVTSGIIFDNILITGDLELARKFGEEIWKSIIKKENNTQMTYDEEEREQREQGREENEDSEHNVKLEIPMSNM